MYLIETNCPISQRKRMSVIIKDSDGQIKILTKGADSVMMHRLRPGQVSCSYCSMQSTLTVVVARSTW
jgi:magnesium-transporting ATPase (P-type)